MKKIAIWSVLLSSTLPLSAQAPNDLESAQAYLSAVVVATNLELAKIKEDIQRGNKISLAAEARRFNKNAASLARMLDPNNTAVVVDLFGDAHPESLPLWKAVEQQRCAGIRAAIAQLTAKIDKHAEQINALDARANLPMLSWLSLEQLKGEIQSYGDKIRAIPAYSQEDSRKLPVLLNALDAARLLADLAGKLEDESKCSDTIKGIDDALDSLLNP